MSDPTAPTDSERHLASQLVALYRSGIGGEACAREATAMALADARYHAHLNREFAAKQLREAARRVDSQQFAQVALGSGDTLCRVLLEIVEELNAQAADLLWEQS